MGNCLLVIAVVAVLLMVLGVHTNVAYLVLRVATIAYLSNAIRNYHLRQRKGAQKSKLH